jgi:hypothetical protein
VHKKKKNSAQEGKYFADFYGLKKIADKIIHALNDSEIFLS